MLVPWLKEGQPATCLLEIALTVSRTLALPGASLTHPLQQMTHPNLKPWASVIRFSTISVSSLLFSFVLMLCVPGFLGMFFFNHSVFCIWRWCIWAMLPGAPVKLERSLQVSSLGRPDNTLYHTFEGKVTRELCRPSFKFRATVQTCKICYQRGLRTGTCYIFKNQSSQIVT